MHKNTLYITFDGLSDPLGQSQILPYLRGISTQGFSIHILSCEKKERLDKEKQTILSLIEGLPITWNYIIYNEEGGVFSRLYYIWQINKLAKQKQKKKKINLIHCRSYLASLIGLSFKRKHNIPFIFDMRGFWADERLDGGIWKKDNLIHKVFYQYFKKKEKQFVSHASAIISLTNNAVNELRKKFSANEVDSKITVIPCCTDTDVFSKRLIKERLSLPGLNVTDHLLVYTGSVGTWYYTREMIDCILVWKSLIPEIKLLILTKDTTELNKILESYNEEQKSCIISGSSSHKDVASYLEIAKAAIFFIKPSYSKIASSPTKMAECWAMDLPIITNSGIGDNDLYFKKYPGGILVNDFKTSDYTLACNQYLALTTEPGVYRQIALNHFDTKMAIEKYTAIYKALTM